MTDQTQQYFRECFSTPAGRVVLGIILNDLGYFDDNLHPEEVCKANYAKTILKYMGLANIDTLRSFVDRLISIPVTQEKKEDET
jgi:hypothetical protein